MISRLTLPAVLLYAGLGDGLACCIVRFRIMNQERDPLHHVHASPRSEQGSPQMIYAVCRPAAVRERINVVRYLGSHIIICEGEDYLLMLGGATEISQSNARSSPIAKVTFVFLAL